MYITHGEYTKLGYKTVPQDQFQRIESIASAILDSYTQDRIKRLSKLERMCLCEIIDIVYKENTSVGSSIVESFSNGSYSERYASEKIQSAHEQAANLIGFYFSADVKKRGVRYAR